MQRILLYMLHVFCIVLPEQILNAIAHVYIDCLGFFLKDFAIIIVLLCATKKKCVLIFIFSLLHFRAKNSQMQNSLKMTICLFVYLTSVKLFTEFEYFIRIKGEQK